MGTYIRRPATSARRSYNTFSAVSSTTDMRSIVIFLLPCAVGLAAAQYDRPYQTTTPVPILKQINRHNEDGSYSYGYEAADGSYKIESKYPDGEVYGKYGFVDDSGSVREIEYGASRRGFEPAGTGINVPPPTLKGNGIAGSNEPDDDGQYREDPSIYYTDPKYTNGERYEPRRPSPPPQQQRPRYQQNAPPAAYNPPAPRSYPEYREPQPQSQYQPQEYRPQYRSQLQPEYETQYRPAAQQQRFQGHPAANVDLNVGSYTVNYRR